MSTRYLSMHKDLQKEENQIYSNQISIQVNT